MVQLISVAFYMPLALDDDDDDDVIIVLLWIVCRLKTLWYTFTSFHNSVEIEVCEA